MSRLQNANIELQNTVVEMWNQIFCELAYIVQEIWFLSNSFSKLYIEGNRFYFFNTLQVEK